MFFKCKHPANMLLVEKPLTFKKIDNDFNKITYHLRCMKCGDLIDISYIELIFLI